MTKNLLKNLPKNFSKKTFGNFDLNEFFLTLFYLGKAKKAPGTVGSIGSVIIWVIIYQIFTISGTSLQNQNIFWLLLLTKTLIYGSFAIPFYAKKCGEIDHKSIVLDEFLGQILAIQICYNFVQNNDYNLAICLLLSFGFFRLFDITKPLFIGWCDKNLKNGFGVMFDDLLAGVFAGIFVTVLLAIFF